MTTDGPITPGGSARGRRPDPVRPQPLRVFLSDRRLSTLRARLASMRQPTWSAWLDLRAAATDALHHHARPVETWHVPLHNRDPAGAKRASVPLREDAIAAYRLALYARVQGEEAFAIVAAKVLRAWTQTLKTVSREDDSPLVFAFHFPVMAFAADLLNDSPHWTREDRRKFNALVRFAALPATAVGRPNHWGNWGVLLQFTCAAHLNDGRLMSASAERWKQLIDQQVALDGHLPFEVGRDGGTGDRGLWYSHLCLTAQTLAAEVGRVNGYRLFDYISPTGKSLRIAFERLAPWARDRRTFPYFTGKDPNDQIPTGNVSYFELLHSRWPLESAGQLLEKSRPLSAEVGAPALTLTHAELADDDEPS